MYIVNGHKGIGLVVQDFKGHVIAIRSLTKMRNLELAAAEALATFQAVTFS
jgi:hypothetical protein